MSTIKVIPRKQKMVLSLVKALEFFTKDGHFYLKTGNLKDGSNHITNVVCLSNPSDCGEFLPSFMPDFTVVNKVDVKITANFRYNIPDLGCEQVTFEGGKVCLKVDDHKIELFRGRYQASAAVDLEFELL